MIIFNIMGYYETEIRRIKREIARVKQIRALVDQQIEDLDISIADLKREENEK